MAKDYMDSWELNGNTVLLQDFGKGKNGGVGVLNSTGKLTSSDITVIYSDKLKTSKGDPNNTPLKYWIENVTPFIATAYGHTLVPFFKEHAEITSYCPEERIIVLEDIDTGKRYIDSKHRGLREFSNSFAGFSYFVKKEEIIGYISGPRINWCYLSDLIEHKGAVTYVSPTRNYNAHYFIAGINDVLYVLHVSSADMTNYYVGILTSTDGINFTEVYEHSCTNVDGRGLSSAYYNNICVFNTKYFRITINNGEFYFSEHPSDSTYTDWAAVYVINGIFTTGRYWSEDGIHWTATSGASLASNITREAYAMANKIMWLSNYSTSCIYTEDGKTLVAYERAPIEYEGSTYNLWGIPCVDNGVAFIQCSDFRNSKFALAKSTDGIHFTIIKVFEREYEVLDGIWAGKGVLLFNTSNSKTLESYMPQKTPDTNIWLPHNPYKNAIKGGN